MHGEVGFVEQGPKTLMNERFSFVGEQREIKSVTVQGVSVAPPELLNGATGPEAAPCVPFVEADVVRKIIPVS